MLPSGHLDTGLILSALQTRRLDTGVILAVRFRSLSISCSPCVSLCAFMGESCRLRVKVDGTRRWHSVSRSRQAWSNYDAFVTVPRGSVTQVSRANWQLQNYLEESCTSDALQNFQLFLGMQVQPSSIADLSKNSKKGSFLEKRSSKRKKLIITK